MRYWTLVTLTMACFVAMLACPLRPFTGTTEPTNIDRPEHGISTLLDVRVAKHRGYDRIVFEFDSSKRDSMGVFEGGVPGYRIGYPLIEVYQCGSGEPVFAHGTPLVVQLLPAQAHTTEGKPTIQWRDSTFNLISVRRAQVICDFEADVQFLFGIQGTHPYRVLELDNRLVIDVLHDY
jgi:hypothetical protein